MNEYCMKNTQEQLALPDFEVVLVEKDQHRTLKLRDFIKQTQQGLVLYFYPKDSTQGCSVQATDFSLLQDKFAHKNYAIIGVSRDTIKSHQNFIAKKELTIALISDPDERLCQHFDVIKEKMMYGKTHLGVVRSTFVFDQTGQMTASFRNVKAKDHAQALLEQL